MLLSEVSIPVLTVIIAGVVTIIGAVSTAAVVVIRALHEVGTTVAKIEGHVNGERTAIEERLKAKDREIKLLHEILERERTSAALLAQALAERTQGRRRSPVLPEPA